MSNIDAEEFLDDYAFMNEVLDDTKEAPSDYETAMEGSPDSGDSDSTQGGIHSAGSPRISGTVRERILAKSPFVTEQNEGRFWHLLNLVSLTGR